MVRFACLWVKMVKRIHLRRTPRRSLSGSATACLGVKLFAVALEDQLYGLAAAIRSEVLSHAKHDRRPKLFQSFFKAFWEPF